MRKNIKVLGAVAGVVASTGSAFTAGTGIDTNVTVGYGTQTLDAASVTNVEYVYDADGTDITKVKVTLASGDVSKIVKAAFGTADLVSCTIATASDAFYTCAITSTTASASKFNVLVTDV